jgi:type I restriction enzyme S subunit
MGWIDVPFEDVFLEPTRNGVSVSSAERASGTPMINMGELFEHKRIPDIPLVRVPLEEPERSRSLLREHDLLFARRSLQWTGQASA